jgi:hypothetical protein
MAVRMVPDGGARRQLALRADGTLERGGLAIGRFDGRILAIGGRRVVTVDADWTIHLAGREDLDMHFTSVGSVLIYRPPDQLAAVLVVDESGVPGFWCAGETEPVRVEAVFAGYQPEMASVAAVLTLFAASDVLLAAVPPSAGAAP